VDQVLGLAITRLQGYEKGISFHDAEEANSFVALHKEVLHNKVSGKNRSYVTGW